jgi:hypothetical protein
MAQDDNRQVAEAAEFRQKLEAMVVVAKDAKKKAAAARTHVLAAVALLEQEQRVVAQLDEAARVAVCLIKPPAPPSNPMLDNSLSSNLDDYEAAVIVNLHLQASGVQNIRSPVSVILDSSSAHYARWRENVLLTLRRYALADHVLFDDSFVDVPAWDRMDMLVKSWIFLALSHRNFKMSPVSVASPHVLPGWPWRIASSATGRLVPSISRPPSEILFKAITM